MFFEGGLFVSGRGDWRFDLESFCWVIGRRFGFLGFCGVLGVCKNVQGIGCAGECWIR